MNSKALNVVRLKGSSITFCDVRCGPTEDKQTVELDSGVYALNVENNDDSVSITLCRQDLVDPSVGAELGEVSIDGAVLGVYDTALFTEKFGADAEDFYDWGESLFEATDVIQVFRESIEPFEFACIPTQLDGVFRMTELLEGSRRVGVRLSASMPVATDANEFRAYQFFLESTEARVEVWLDPEFDDESIIDSIVDGLEDALGRATDVKAAKSFIREIQRVEFAVHVDEELYPSQDLDLSRAPDKWNTDAGRLCKFLRDVMLASHGT